MHDQVSLDLDSFLLDHEFPEDYDLEEGDGLASQAAGLKPKHKSRRTKAYTTVEDKLLCEFWRDIGQDPMVGAEQKESTFWTRVHREFHERKKFLPYQI